MSSFIYIILLEQTSWSRWLKLLVVFGIYEGMVVDVVRSSITDVYLPYLRRIWFCPERIPDLDNFFGFITMSNKDWYQRDSPRMNMYHLHSRCIPTDLFQEHHNIYHKSPYRIHQVLSDDDIPSEYRI